MKTSKVLFGLFASFGDHGLSANQIIRLACPLGVSSTNARSHLSRMKNKKLLFKKDGIYFFDKKAQSISRNVVNKLTADENFFWDGKWVMVNIQFHDQQLRDKEKVRRKLKWMGFEQRMNGFYLRPLWPNIDWLKIGYDICKSFNHELVIGEIFDKNLEELKQLAENLWGINKISANAEKINLKMINLLNNNTSDYQPEDWHKLRFDLSGGAYGVIGQDPLLPFEIAPERKKIKLLKETLKKFDKKAREYSAAFTNKILNKGVKK